MGIGRAPLISVLVALFLTGGSLSQSAAQGDIYELRHGSVLADDCFCDRLPVETPLRGTFMLALESETLYRISEVDFATTDGKHRVQGFGSLELVSASGTTQEWRLTVSVDGAGGIEIESGAVPLAAPVPAFDVRVLQTNAADPLHVIGLRIVAAPRVEQVAYDLDPESQLTYWYSRQAPIEIPLTGTFLLGEIPTGNSSVATYRLDAIDLRGALPAQADWRFRGGGIYDRSDRAAGQAMSLELDVELLGFAQAIRLESDGSEATVPFPSIDIELRRTEPLDLNFYILHFVARPAGLARPRFQRGDCNGNALAQDSLADVIFLLNYNFRGGSEPPCLAACDFNGDGEVLGQVSDAVYYLRYSFLGGLPPPPPFPGCGSGQVSDAVLGCASPPACE